MNPVNEGRPYIIHSCLSSLVGSIPKMITVVNWYVIFFLLASKGLQRKCQKMPNSEQSDAGSAEVDFLANFKCGVCHLAPAFEQAVQVAPVWAAGEMPGLVTWDMQPNLANLKRVMVYCNTCHRFFHGGCILGSPFVNEINQMAELMLMKIEGYPIGAFKCNNCFHNQ